MLPEEISGFTVYERFPAHKNRPNYSQFVLVHNSRLVAKVFWDYKDDYVEVIEIDVVENFRRRGIATEIYDTLMQITKKPLKWSPNAWASDIMPKLAESFCRDKRTEDLNENSFLVHIV